MRILDLFCGAGGAAMGYHRAFPDAEIVGVDLNPQPRYPFQFVQASALGDWPLGDFDLIHASPPCQDHSSLSTLRAKPHGSAWMLPATIERLCTGTTPWVVENVVGAPMDATVVLCGASFGLGAAGRDLARHRLFLTSFPVPPLGCRHRRRRVIGVYGNGGGSSKRDGNWYTGTAAERREAMGIDWMNRAELSQAIPPAYTEYIGNALAGVLSDGVPELGRGERTG